MDKARGYYEAAERDGGLEEHPPPMDGCSPPVGLGLRRGRAAAVLLTTLLQEEAVESAR